jgi:hypothetical protein
MLIKECCYGTKSLTGREVYDGLLMLVENNDGLSCRKN